MSLNVDVRFVSQLSHRLSMFRKTGDYLWNFRCPFCGDSNSRKTKARGYMFRDPSKQDHLRYKCHNCGRSDNLKFFLSQIDTELFKQYVAESFLDEASLSGTPIVEKKPTKKPEIKFSQRKTSRITRPEPLIGCPSIFSLPDTHPAKEYIVNRKIPVEFHSQLYWTDDFAVVARKVCLDMSEETNLKENEGRILIPLLDRQCTLLGIQGRSIDPKTKLRYITIKTRDDAPKIYGMHRLPLIPNKVYVVEGPFDSMFLPECIAMTGSDPPATIPRSQCTLIYDNEPRNGAICDKMEGAIEKGYRICIWPKRLDLSDFSYKDINEMIIAGYTPAKTRQIIDQNTYFGIEASLRFHEWRKSTQKKKYGNNNRKAKGLD